MIPTQYGGEFKLIVYENDVDEMQHVALIKGEITPDDNVLVRVHSECLTGDLFHSNRCECGEQLVMAMQMMEKEGKGHADIVPGGNIEFIQLNPTDPWTEVDGERASLKTKHPLLSDPAVRDALNLLVDRQAVQDHIYGRTGVATRNFLNNPERFRSKTTKYEFNVDKASDVLEKAGVPQKTVTLVAPFAGSVTAKSAFEGQTTRSPGLAVNRDAPD